MTHKLQDLIELAWEGRAQITAASAPDVRQAVEDVIGDLNAGRIRVAERQGVGQWTVNQWVKKAVLLSFRLSDNKVVRAGDLGFFDKVQTKFSPSRRSGHACHWRARGASGRGTPRQLHRQERGADAQLREHDPCRRLR